MSPFEINVVMIFVSMVAGAVIWHFVHGKVYAEIAVLKTEVSYLKAIAPNFSLPSLPSMTPPAAPKAPVATTTAASANPTQRAS